MLLIIVALPQCAVASQGEEQQRIRRANDTIRFEVSMTCQNCVKSVMENIPRERGVRDVRPDLESKTVLVVFRRNRNSSERLIKSFERLGFTAKVQEEKKKDDDGK